jgi:peptidoglycan/xylan/chitin deacetylase (PgdA/CDA1 family)
MSVDEQRDDLVRTRQLLEQITGEQPSGHKTPGWRFSNETIDVLQELGFLWNMDYASNDVPFLMTPDPAKPAIVQLPPSRLWDDYSYFVDPIMPPRHAFEMWRDDIDVLRAEGKLMCLTFHPWVTGRPAPSRALTMFLDYVISLGDVWIARADHLASWWRDQATSTAAQD